MFGQLTTLIIYGLKYFVDHAKNSIARYQLSYSKKIEIVVHLEKMVFSALEVHLSTLETDDIFICKIKLLDYPKTIIVEINNDIQLEYLFKLLNLYDECWFCFYRWFDDTIIEEEFKYLNECYKTFIFY